VNARFAEIFGFDSPGDIIGKPLSLTVHPDNIEMVSDINRTRQGGGSAPLRYEFKGVTKDGAVRFIEVAASRINYRGEPTSLAYLRDITDYKNLEDQLRQSQKMEAIGTLAGGIAHDFNNILAAIVGFTEMAIDDVSDRPQVEKNLKNVLGSAMRARDLVRQILTFSRKTGYERTPTVLSPVVKETVHLLRASIPATIGIKLRITATSDIVLAAPIEVQQVLMNLATNASLAMEEKGGVLEISLTDIDFMPDSPIFVTDVMPGE
jgi:PAS domain S-box-containing protein